MLFKSSIFYTIGKLSKHRYLKRFCIFDLKLWLKSYDKKKSFKNDYNDFSPKDEGKLVP
jgi:hypothetical protein